MSLVSHKRVARSAGVGLASPNRIVGNWVSGNGVDPDSGSGHPTGIALFSAVVPSSVLVTGNHVSNEYWGIFIAGPVTVTGLSSNLFSATVTQPTN